MRLSGAEVDRMVSATNQLNMSIGEFIEAAEFALRQTMEFTDLLIPSEPLGPHAPKAVPPYYQYRHLWRRTQ